MNERESADERHLRYWAAVLSIVAGKVHGLVMFDHFEVWWGYGLFFLLAAASQVLYGIVLVARPWKQQERANQYNRLAYMLGIAGNSAIVVFYAITRTVGVPFLGPEAGEVEELTTISLISKAIELALIAWLFLLLIRGADKRRANAPAG